MSFYGSDHCPAHPKTGKEIEKIFCLFQYYNDFEQITPNTFFQQKEIHNITWIYSMSRHGHIPAISFQKKKPSGYLNCSFHRGAYFEMEHMLVLGKLKLHLMRKLRSGLIKVPNPIDELKPSFKSSGKFNLRKQMCSINECPQSSKWGSGGKNWNHFDENDKLFTKILGDKNLLQEK